MRIFVDADACPKAVKEILYRAALRTSTMLILVANRPLQTPISPFIKTIQADAGFDEADNLIADQVTNGDLVITADIPLAEMVISKGAQALNPRGKLYTNDNIKQQLATRDLMAHLRDNLVISGGPSSFNKSNNQAFAQVLDKLLAAKVRA